MLKLLQGHALLVERAAAGKAETFVGDDVTGPPGALSFDVKPEIAQEKSL